MNFPRPLGLACGCIAFLSTGLVVGDAAAAPAYVRSNVGAPWGSTTNEEAMDLAFGVGVWDDLRYETVDPMTLFAGGYHFIYLEGSDSNASELEAFLGANQDLVETWVGGGGTLLLNAAPNEGASQNWGFGGVVLNYSDAADSGIATDPLHPIWQGPFLPCATDFTGSSYAHASVSGPGLAPLITNVDNPMGNPNLAELPFGSGTVIFGGLTTANFWMPQPDATNLRANIINYLASGAQQGPCHDGDLDEGEECDDGNFLNNDGCVGACQLAECGDGYTQLGVEPCDDGNDVNDDDCLVGCIAPTCGDGYVQAGVEGCDDSNDDNTDTCVAPQCQLASCGDGYVFAGFEECDDANDTPGDGCTGCQVDSAESSSDGGAESSSGGGESTTGGAETSSGGDGTSGAVDTSGGDEGTTGVVDDSGSSGPITGAGTDDSATGAEGGSSESTGAAADGGGGGGCSCTTQGRGGRGGVWFASVLVGLGLRRRRAASRTRR